MKVRDLEGKECDILPLPNVAAMGLELIGVGFELIVNPNELKKKGQVYIYQEPMGSEAAFEAAYAGIAQILQEETPSKDDVLSNDGLVLGLVKYHLVTKADGNVYMHVDDYEGMEVRVAVDENGEMFVEGDDGDDDVDDEEAIKAMRENWKDYIIPIPPPPKKCSSEVFLTLAYKYYDAIKRGEKTTEYRDYTPNWVKKLLSHPIKTVKFQRGYGGPGHAEPEQMVFEVKKIWLYESETDTKGDPENPPEGILPEMLAIDLGNRIS